MRNRLCQPFDFGVHIAEGGVPIAGDQVVYAMVVTADWWTDKQEPFTVTLTIPPGEPKARCATLSVAPLRRGDQGGEPSAGGVHRDGSPPSRHSS